jgi:glycosyltransferase involved in cell wall biosynthesis
MISVLILTLNEDSNLPSCLGSVSWCDDIVVLDSFSTDRTPSVAQEFGARVIQRKFDNWASHQNWAMANIRFKHKWVFYLDADERMTEDLRQEICAIAADQNEDRVAFYCGRKNYFMGKWIAHCYPPGFIMRFFKPSRIRFERLVNPTPIVDGKYGYLEKMFIHFNFSKGLSEWFDKHNKYSLLEAMEGMKLKNDCHFSLSALLSGDAAIRRKALKNLSFKMPLRSLLKFCYLYFLRLGFLDGHPGFIYCTLQSLYEYMIVLKMYEMERNEKNLPI